MIFQTFASKTKLLKSSFWHSRKMLMKEPIIRPNERVK